MLEDKKSFEVVYKAAARDHRKLAISYFLLKLFNQALRSVLAVMRIQIHQPLYGSGYPGGKNFSESPNFLYKVDLKYTVAVPYKIYFILPYLLFFI